MVNSLNEFLFNPDFIFNVHAQVINPLTVYEDALIGWLPLTAINKQKDLFEYLNIGADVGGKWVHGV